jgi:hypothetical protein
MLKTKCFDFHTPRKKATLREIFPAAKFSAAGIPVYSYKPIADWEDIFHHFHTEKRAAR